MMRGSYAINIIDLVAVAIGGGLGAASRYLLALWVEAYVKWSFFPSGILLVNSIGALLIGFVGAMFLFQDWLSSAWRALIVIGFLGGFTTFSSITCDTLMLWRQQHLLQACLNVLLSLGFGFLFTALGFWLGHRVFIGS